MPSVLIVEDDPDIRELERVVLECDGYETRTAKNGRDALEALEASTPCLILLDLMMPVMDGVAFLAERRRRDLAMDVPVVCVTAAGAAMIANAIRLGARECLTKPTDIGALCEKVGQGVSIADRRRSRRSAVGSVPSQRDPGGMAAGRD